LYCGSICGIALGGSPPLFVLICRQLSISDDIEADAKAAKKQVMIQEYTAGQRTGAELLQRFTELRREIGFPEVVI